MANPILIELGASVLKRVIDTKKPVSKTNAATAGGVGVGSVAMMLIQSPDTTSQLLGYGLGVLAAVLTLYKQR